MLSKLICGTSAQKVLYFLLAHPDKKFYDREISRLARVSRAATNYSLRSLVDTGLIEREKKGRMYFYCTTVDDPVVRQLKIVQNLIHIRPLTEKLKAVSIKIVLYGSSAAGTNHTESDIDLFVLSREPKKVKELIYKSPCMKKLQYVVNDPQELSKLKKENPVFYEEVLNGIVVYEEKE